MYTKKITRLHWKLFFPLVTMLWIIIGLTIFYFVRHEKARVRQNLENRLLNVNNTVIEAYERGQNLSETVNFIRLFTDNTTLTPLRISVYDDERNLIADNPAATIRLHNADGSTNMGLEELMDKHNDSEVTDIVYEDDLSMISAKMSSDGKIFSLAALPYDDKEVRNFLRVDGGGMWVAVLILAVLASVSAYIGVRAVCKNVYALRDFAIAMADGQLPDDVDDKKFSKDELGDVSRNLLRMYRDKINAQQEKIMHERQISLNINHELNTPVSIIKGYVDTVLSNPDMPAETRHNFLKRIQENADRLSHLVGDISQLLRLSEGGAELNCTDLDFTEFAQRIKGDVEQSNLTRDMKFRIDLPEHCMVKAHESLLTNALLNLIYNAARYSGGTEISLEKVGEQDGCQVFAFADNGTGVEERHIDRLFDLFYRVDSGRSRRRGGSGLGLPLVRKILTAMNGYITVANAPEGGLKFTFALPSGN